MQEGGKRGGSTPAPLPITIRHASCTGGRTHTSDRHTQDTQDGRRATTHSACTCRWTSVKHRVGWVGITEASAACAHTEPSSRPPVRALAIAEQRAFACISKRFHPLSPQCDQQDQRVLLLTLRSSRLRTQAVSDAAIERPLHVSGSVASRKRTCTHTLLAT